MSERYPPINPKCPHFLHGGDYNPDQWPPEIWDEDMRLMKRAGCNAMSVGIFSWVHLEPEEGKFTFDWLDTVLDKLAANGVFAVLATPSGSKPAWMSEKYPEVCRVTPEGRRELHTGRHNHCPSSPVYREKVRLINSRLAERYASHPALIAWHVSNEYGGECHCDLCYAAFRRWLKHKYETLKHVNQQWWAAFWSHDFTDWQQIRPIDSSIHGLMLDWRRFVTEQTVDFMRSEIEPLKKRTPGVPVTTNMMGTWSAGLDYWKFVPHVDVVSWDSYPFYHDRDDNWKTAATVSFMHEIYRAFKGGRPYMLMESTPSACNWWPVMKLKRPGVHRLASLQAVAHGADSVMYFQWRAGRGGTEKFHGAVVDHSGRDDTRVFREVAEVGEILKKLDPVVGTTAAADAAIIWEWENEWAINSAQGPRREKRDYTETCQAHYRPFWKRGVPVDVINMECAFSGYKLLVAPMLYMLRPGVAPRIEEFVRNGGTFVATYWSGIADQNDLCFTGGRPGPLRALLGIWSEEIDALYDDESNAVRMGEGDPLGLTGSFRAHTLCDLIHAEGAQVLAAYEKDFYAGRPALTVNSSGNGRAYYVAFRSDDDFLDAFYGGLIRQTGLQRALDADLPEGVTARTRTAGAETFLFLLNFTREPQVVGLGNVRGVDLLTGAEVSRRVELPGYGSVVLRRASSESRGTRAPPDSPRKAGSTVSKTRPRRA